MNKGQTPLHYAATSGNIKVAQILIENGADPNAANVEGRTPIFNAAEEGRREVAQLLIENGADLDVRGEDGYTPLDWAAMYGSGSGVFQLLFKHMYPNEATDESSSDDE